MKVVLCGPPRSGKSCFREGLKQSVRAIPGSPYPYVITACPDGEGAWFQAAVDNNPKVAAACKTGYKGRFTEEFVRRMEESVRNCEIPLTVVDIGGIPSVENERICAGATHAILLAGDIRRFEEWRAFCKKTQLLIIAELNSDYHGTEDNIRLHHDRVWRGSVHHLERGQPLAERPTIKKIAEILVQMVAGAK